jgi:hypothetical protein
MPRLDMPIILPDDWEAFEKRPVDKESLFVSVIV